MIDPIIEEVRKVRDAHASRFNYDLDAIFRDIKEKEKTSGRSFVSFAPRTIEAKPAQQPSPDAISTARRSLPLEEAPAI